MRSVRPEHLPTLRAAAQGLHRPRGMRHPAEVARAIAGAQAQDPHAGRLSLRARSPALTAADADRARSEERSLVRAWAMRKTMHLLPADDVDWMLPLFEPIVIAESSRRLAHFGVDAAAQERALAAIERLLTERGPVLRDELVPAMHPLGIEVDTPVRTHLVRLAVASNIACLGPDRGARTTLTLARDWLPKRRAFDREAALRELARRYMRAFAPATEADFAGWAGLPLRDVRLALAGIAGELSEVRLGGAVMVAPKGRSPRGREGVVRLLPAFDTYLMGHRDAGFMSTPSQWRRICPGGGLLRPVILRDGVALGTWSIRRGPKAITVELGPFAPLDRAARAAVEAEVEDIGRFEGRPATLAQTG